jgi:hypothetical protein
MVHWSFAFLLIGGIVLVITRAGDNKVAQIEFTEARLENNGNLKIAYHYTTPSGTFLLETDFENAAKAAESRGSGTGVNSSSSGYSVSIPNISTPPPSMLVTTGKTYYLSLRDHTVLPMYHFTNDSGTVYHGELSLMRLGAK